MYELFEAQPGSQEGRRKSAAPLTFTLGALRTPNLKGIGMSTDQENVQLAILAEMYNELRAYRDKEFQTFLFAFPIIGAGFISSLESCAVATVLT